MRRIVTLAILAPSLLVLAGCTVGPDYKRPALPPTASSWMESDATGPEATGPVDAQWWKAFGDPELDRLVAMAIASAPDLREAEARLAEARAGRDAAAGGALPQVEAKGSATRNRLSENGQIPIGNFPGFQRDFSLFDLGFDASWEIDLWGRNRRQVEAAGARVEAAEWSKRDVTLAIIAETARNYVELRAAQAQLKEALAQQASLEDLARLTRMRFAAGEDTRQAAEDAAGQAANAKGAAAQAEAAVATAAYRIATLLGKPPEDVVPGLKDSVAPVPLPPATIAMGIRSQLLERRPDVRAAERQLAAATADIGVATADLYPRFSLLGSVGQQGRSVDDLASSASTRFSVGPSFSWPIFSAGRIRAQIRQSDARADAAAARYEKAVTGALSDSESAANRWSRARVAREQAEAAVASASTAFDLATLRFKSGEDNRLQLDQAHIRLAQAHERLAQLASGESQAAVALYKALGGGWSAR